MIRFGLCSPSLCRYFSHILWKPYTKASVTSTPLCWGHSFNGSCSGTKLWLSYVSVLLCSCSLRRVGKDVELSLLLFQWYFCPATISMTWSTGMASTRWTVLFYWWSWSASTRSSLTPIRMVTTKWGTKKLARMCNKKANWCTNINMKIKEK